MDETDTVPDEYVGAAVALVAGSGWDALTFDGLVAALGASRSTIHDRFPKAAWKSKLVEWAFAMLMVEIVAQLKAGRSPTWSDAETYFSSVDGRLLIHVLPLAFVDDSPIADEVLSFYDRLPPAIAETLTDKRVSATNQRIRSAIDAYISPETMRAAR